MCTGFAVYYASNPIFGSNFDYPKTDLTFSIEPTKTGTAFIFSFKYGDFFFKNTWMNSSGLFSCFNMLFDDHSEILQRSSELLPGLEFSQLLMNNASSVEDAFEIINGKRYAILTKPKAHQMIADKYGKAFILEEGKKDNELTHMVDDFIVITNFKNSDFKNVWYREVKGCGADRYVMAYENLVNRSRSFNFENAFEILEKTSSREGDFRTLSSMVFDPKNLEIYIVLHRKFDKIWKISIREGKMDSFSGFSKQISFQIDHEITDKDILGMY